jgi:outer membrane receptor for monomeric catechols
VADLVVGWRVNQQLDLQVNISNLFDRRYFETWHKQWRQLFRHAAQGSADRAIPVLIRQ